MFDKIRNFKYKKMILFYIYESIYLIFIDYFNQYLITESISINDYMIKEALLFNVIWILLLFAILYILKPKIRKIVTVIINLLLLIFSLVNYFINSYFNSVFSWKDIFLSKDGASFVSSIYKFIDLRLILFILLSLFMILLIYKTKTRNIYKLKSKQTIIILLIIALLLGNRFKLKKQFSNVVDGWNASEIINNSSNYYTNWIEPTKLIRICGTYEYLIRDFYFSFIKQENGILARKNVTEYIKENEDKLENEYTGIFKNKNLIFIMMESMDDWLINEDVTPTIYNMMQHGFNFNNHYSPGYVTGDTANTEFIANTGIYPYINKLSPYYAYVDNYYPFSIANLFKKKGYIVNSFHRSNGFIYNRENMHISLGYEKYHNYLSMGIDEENVDLDTFIIKNGYEHIVSKGQFMSFIITYSPHSPYTYDKIECKNNLEEIKKIYPNETDEEKLCAFSSARETDNMFKLLLEKLKEDNLLDDTIIVAFSDHPNRLLLTDDETELLNKTIFFIYHNQMESNQIYNISSSINILPTIVNLFDINSGYVYPGYDMLDNNNNYVIFKDYTYYDGKEIKDVTDEMYDMLKYSSNILISDYYVE